LTVQLEDGNTTPALESPKYLTEVVHYRTEVDLIDGLQNEASVIAFCGVNGSKSLQQMVRLTFEVLAGSGKDQPQIVLKTTDLLRRDLSILYYSQISAALHYV
jgi:hypothetical protein